MSGEEHEAGLELEEGRRRNASRPTWLTWSIGSSKT